MRILLTIVILALFTSWAYAQVKIVGNVTLHNVRIGDVATTSTSSSSSSSTTTAASGQVIMTWEEPEGCVGVCTYDVSYWQSNAIAQQDTGVTVTLTAGTPVALTYETTTAYLLSVLPQGNIEVKVRASNVSGTSDWSIPVCVNVTGSALTVLEACP